MKKETDTEILLEIRELLRKQKDIFNIDELSAYTGYEKSYIYKLTSKRKIPHSKTAGGNSLFFRKSRIDEWLMANEVKTIDEIQYEANKQKL